MEATGLLLDLAERALNAFAAAVSSTEPSDAGAMQRLVAAYGAARQETLQDALTASVSVCTRGAAATPETRMLLVCERHPDVPHLSIGGQGASSINMACQRSAASRGLGDARKPACWCHQGNVVCRLRTDHEDLSAGDQLQAG